MSYIKRLYSLDSKTSSLFKKLENKFLNLDCEEISIAIMRGLNNELITMQNNFYNYEKK